ncbi:MAG TPA: hypothetical protein VFU06_05525 [Longimicrobiales bacterium]|nr:hypothetical protein [Longimicrobiales bacterium]
MLPQPGFLLLLWCGIAATVVAGPIARHTPAAARGRPRAIAAVADLLLFPLLYAVALELIGQADLTTGVVLGATHGGIELVAASLRPDRPSADVRVRTFLARTLYGVVFAFVYIVPPP